MRAVLTTGSEPILVFDRRGRVLTGSAGAARATGLSLRELPGAGVADLAIPDDLRDDLEEGLAAVLESGMPHEGSWRKSSHPDSAIRRCQISPVLGSEGEVSGAICRLVTTAPSGHEGALRALVDSVDDLVFSLDRDLRFTGVYGRWPDAGDVSPATMLGRTIREVLGPEASAIHEEAAGRSLEGEHVVYEWEVTSRPDRPCYQASLAPLQETDGTISGVAGVVRAVTGRRREQEELSRLLDWSRLVKEEWKITLDSLPDFIALVDFVGCVIRGNRTLENWGLRGPGEIAGFDFHELLHPGCSTPDCYLAEALRHAWGSILDGRELVVEADDPRLRRFVRFRFRPVVHADATHATPTMLAVVEDLTEAPPAMADADRRSAPRRGNWTRQRPKP